MTCYVDTSALAKIYHRESGTETMLEMYAGGESIQISELARLEFLGTTVRKLREGQLDEKAYQALLERFGEDVDKRYELLHFSSLIVEETARVLGTYGRQNALRTLDAIQFAFYNIYCEEDTVFVCADLRLAALIQQQGHPTLDPQTVVEA